MRYDSQPLAKQYERDLPLLSMLVFLVVQQVITTISALFTHAPTNENARRSQLNGTMKRGRLRGEKSGVPEPRPAQVRRGRSMTASLIIIPVTVKRQQLAKMRIH